MVKTITVEGLEPQLASRQNHFNVIRLFLALLVCFDHAGLIVTGVEGSEMIFLFGLSSGYLAVNGFFFLSGILIARSLHERGITSYYFASRLLRLYPALIVLVLLATFLIGPISADGKYWLGAENFAYMFQVLTFGNVSGGPVGFYTDNPFPNEFAIPLWTLRYELLCYLAAPLVFLLGFNKRPLAVLVALLALAAAYSLLPFTEHSFLTSALVSNVVRFGFCFGLGILAWQLRAKIFGQLSWVLITTVMFVICGVVGFGETVAGTLWISAILLWLGLRLPLKQHLETDISYGIYIWHYPIMQMLFGEVSEFGEWSILLVSAPIVVLVSWLSWAFIEKPALRFRKYFRSESPITKSN